MPRWIAAIARANPITHLVDTLRQLQTPTPDNTAALLTAATVFAAGLVIAPLAGKLADR